MALTKASFSMVSGAPANVLDFGAVGDGLTNCTTAIQAAINSVAATGGAVYFPPGEYLISSSLTVSTYGVSLIGASGAALWNGASTVNDGGAIILKSAAMTADAIVVTGGKFTMQDISLIGQDGNTAGDGVYLKDAQSCVLLNVCVAKFGGNGIRIGTKTGSVGNCNGWQLTNVTSQRNAEHGVVIHDESTTVPVDGPNANAGTATGLQVAGNSGAGLRIINGQFNTFVGLLSQQNSGYGVALFGTATLSLYTTFIGGDVEANVDGNWFVSGDAKHVTIAGAFPNVPTLDPDQFNTSFTSGNCSIRGLYFQTGNVLQYYVNGTGTPYIAGSSASGFNTYTSQYLFYTRIGTQMSCEGSVQLSAKGTGGNVMSGNLQLYFDNAIPLSKNSTGATAVFTLVPSGGFTVGAGFSPNLVGIMQPNTRYLDLYKVSTTDGSLTALTPSDITDSFRVYFTGTYLTS